MATDEEVQEARDRVERLRQELADHERERVDNERALANEITLGQLAAEEARLQAQLTQQGDSSTQEAVVRGAQSPIAAVQADLERAKAVQKAVADNLTKSTEPAATPAEPTSTETPPTTPPPTPVPTQAPVGSKTPKGGSK